MSDTNTYGKNNSSELRKILWPIESYELKKFLPMAAIMFCMLFNYSTLRSIKDGFVVNAIGAESLGFLKTYFVLPFAVLAMVLYVKLCNLVNTEKVFHIITATFVGYIALFAFVLYPNAENIHTDPAVIENLALEYRNFQWFIRIFGKWSYATLYVVAELWGSMMISLLFYQFANQITKTEEAKRFYPMFGLLGNFGLILTGIIIPMYLGKEATVSENEGLTYIFCYTIAGGIAIMALVYWINRNVLTDIRYYDPNSTKAKKSKSKLSMSESFKLILSSKYLGLIALLIIAYGISINLVEGVWKSKIRELYTTQTEYMIYMSKFQSAQGITAILFMIISTNILRKLSWYPAAILTPSMILITGLGFFGFIFFGDFFHDILGTFLVMQPLALAILMGAIQNILSKSTKYSLFDATKEMAYIPLDDELKSKGKAAVEVVGGRFGKSGGGLIQSTFFMLMPTLTFTEATPYFAIIFFGIVVAWIYAVKALSIEYSDALENRENINKL